jgi:glucosamine--fructose-6-phosphate aminotransferase (isomerizing)
MCGISGVTGQNAARLSLQLILGQLERGIDGTGVAYVDNSRMSVLKEPTNPVAFAGKYFVRLDPRTRAAVAHNRMPSRGNISYYNTHPFVSCDRQLAIVHNGTTFFRKSTIMRIKKNHRILGDTDSEIVCHLLEQYFRIHGDLVTALTELADSEFSGAILVLTKGGELYGLRKGLEPIHYCVTGTNVFVASTEKAIGYLVNEKTEIKRLKSGQIIKVSGLNVSIHDTDHVTDTDFEDPFSVFCGTDYPCSWRHYFRKANTLKFYF